MTAPCGRALVQPLGRLQRARTPTCRSGCWRRAGGWSGRRAAAGAILRSVRLTDSTVRVGAGGGGRDRLGALTLGECGPPCPRTSGRCTCAAPREPKRASTWKYVSGLERVDLEVAAHDQRERRRLHPAERDDAAERATALGRGPGGVHAHQPVGLGARRGRRPRGSASPRRRAGARTPRGSRPGSSTRPTAAAPASWPCRRPGCSEDQLALAAGVAAVHDLVDVRALHQPLRSTSSCFLPRGVEAAA